MCARLYDTPLNQDQIKEELRKYVLMKPLEFMITTFLDFNIPREIIIRCIDSYNSYLHMLNNEGFRKEMTSLDMHNAYGNERFEKARANSHVFLNALTDVFLKDSNKIGIFTIKYGVF
jgi:hypothetical protein